MAEKHKTRVRDQAEMRRALHSAGGEIALREWDALMEAGRRVAALRLARRYGVKPAADESPGTPTP